MGLPREMDRSGPTVSVVIPTDGDDEYLPDALESVGAQSHSNIELVLVDSAHVAWLAAVSSEYDWITYLSAPSQGVAEARNTGIAAATGRYIAFLDADDYWHPRKLETQLAAIGDRDFASSAYYLVDYVVEDGPTVELRDDTAVPPGDVCRQLIARDLDAHLSTVLMRTSALDDRPFHEDISLFEDVLFTVEHARGGSVVHEPEPLAVCRRRSRSLTAQADVRETCHARLEGYRYLRERYPDLAAPAERAIGTESYRLAVEHLREDDIRSARSQLRQTLRFNSWDLKAAGLLVATYLDRSGPEILSLIERANQYVGAGTPANDDRRSVVAVER